MVAPATRVLTACSPRPPEAARQGLASVTSTAIAMTVGVVAAAIATHVGVVAAASAIHVGFVAAAIAIRVDIVAFECGSSQCPSLHP